jgi:hypothetical protein
LIVRDAEGAHMADAKDRPPVPDVLLYRPIAGKPPEVWPIALIAEPRLGAYLQAGWTVIISANQVLSAPISKPFNPPRS